MQSMQPLNPNTREMEIAQDIFKSHPFATLLLGQDGEALPEVSHLPMLYNQAQERFYCHVAKNNPVVPLLLAGQQQAMVVYRAEHGYVSPTWSAQIKVPTWDYCVVHVQGKLSVIEDHGQRLQSMREQIAAFETHWSIDDIDDKLLSQLLNAICLLQLDVIQMHHRYKMSQTKSDSVKTAILTELERQDNSALAKQYERLFRQ